MFNQCFNIASMKKSWFIAPMKYNPNGKAVMAPMEFSFMVYSSNGKSMIL